MEILFNNLATLRYVILDGGKSRRHRYTIVDKLNFNRVLSKFDDQAYAEQSLNQIRADYIERLRHEYTRESLSVA